MTNRTCATFACALILLTLPRQEFSGRARGEELDLRGLQIPQLIRTSIGVTRSGTSIPAFISQGDLDIHLAKHRVLIVGGLDGSPHTARAAVNMMQRFYSEDRMAPLRKIMSLSAVPCGNPDGLKVGLRNNNGSGGDPARGYPPPEPAYTSPSNPEAQYLWRWIGMHAPDMVIELIDGSTSQHVSPSNRPKDALALQLPVVPACKVGTIPAHSWSVAPGDLAPLEEITQALLDELKREPDKLQVVEYSKARLERQLRDRRTPIEVSEQLAKVYGHELANVAYIPAVACLSRIRLGALTDNSQHLSDIQKITREYLAGDKPTLTDKSGGSEYAGHILWGELYDATKNRDYVKLVLNAADRAFDANGQPLEAMPTHSEMSDAVFMSCPILAQAGRLTGNKKYFDMCLRHMRFMLKLNLRKDGLHRHSPLDESAWGRGNGFPALGLSLALEDLPLEHPGRQEMLVAFNSHLSSLIPHQDPTGAWHQVVDHPESYRELTSTCMITYAMARGMRRGWLPKEKFEASMKKGWGAVKARVASDGSLVDVCTGTGKQKSLREYYDRQAILGQDGRGGAMAMLVATEIAAWERSNP